MRKRSMQLKPDKRRRLLTAHVRNQMIKRCNDRKTPSYPNYGGRGITVCKEWMESLDNFINDMGLKPDGYSIERIDNNKGYSKANCAWIPRGDQNKNRRSCKMYKTPRGKLCLKDVWREYAIDGVTYRRLHTRLERGWGIIRALRQKPTSSRKGTKFGELSKVSSQ